MGRRRKPKRWEHAEFDWEGKSGWVSGDHFGSKGAGMEAAYEATPEAYKELYFLVASRHKDAGEVVTSKLVTGIIGMPPGHPSRVGAVHGAWVRMRGLRPNGVEKADDRHQGHHYTW